MCLSSFGDDFTQPPPLPCSKDGALVANGASRQSRVSHPRGGLFFAGTASTATMAIFHQPPFWFNLTKEIKSRTSNQHATDYSSLWKMKFINTNKVNSGVEFWQLYRSSTRMFVFLGPWRALLCGEVLV